MEPIKITDKLTLRQEALRMALERANAESNIHNALKLAKEYEEFLLGNAELSEFVDPQSEHKYFADLIAKMQESFKSNPWISADSEMRPQDNMLVIVKIDETDDYFIGKYTRERGWEVANAPHNRSIVAWHPIPPFVEPLLKL